MYAGKSWIKAVERARANANWSKVPWYVFMDTSGNYRIEKVRPAGVAGGYVMIMPKKKENEYGNVPDTKGTDQEQRNKEAGK